MCLMCFKVNACVLALRGLCIQCASEARVHICLSVTAVTDLHFCAFLKAQAVDRQGCRRSQTYRGLKCSISEKLLTHQAVIVCLFFDLSK